MARPKLTRAQRIEVIRQYKDGVPVKDIVAASGISTSAIAALARSRGVPLRRNRSCFRAINCTDTVSCQNKV